MRSALACLCASALLSLGVAARADVIADTIRQVTLPEYQGYLRVLTGIDPVPGTPPVYLTNRYTTYPEARVAANWLAAQLTGWGFSVEQHQYNVNGAPNVIAELRGTTRPDDIYILASHYDTYVSNGQQHLAPGCDDNGSGTAAVLTAARLLAAQQFEGTLRFISFSGEEQGLVGSGYYAQRCAQLGEQIRGVIDYDMLLHPGFDNQPQNPDYDVDLKTNTGSLPLANYVAGMLGQYTSIDYQVVVQSGGSDQASFWRYGYQAFGLSENTTAELYGGSNSSYHRVTDTMFDPHYDWEFGLEVVRGGMAGLMGLAGPVPEPGSAAALLVMAVLIRRRTR